MWRLVAGDPRFHGDDICKKYTRPGAALSLGQNFKACCTEGYDCTRLVEGGLGETHSAASASASARVTMSIMIRFSSKSLGV